MFVVYAHRGASEYYPENTLSSFYAGVDMGANGIENDVQKTKDGVLVVFHDDTLDRVTDGSGSISDYTYRELLEFTVKNEKYGRSDKIMTFDEFLKYFGWRELTLAVELKQYGIAGDVIDMIDSYGVRDKVIITSFKYEELQAAREYDKNIRLGWLYWGETDGEKIKKLKAINAFQACPKAKDLTENELKLIYENGFECRAWGISDTDIMKKAVEMGVNGGMTVNFPDKLLEYLKQRI
jgi:glycerophosphoryl diester phosphodiesterase